MGDWTFLAGIVLGVLGLGTYFLTDAATMGRGVGYAMAALAPALLVIGAVLRFPFPPMATYLVAVGGTLTLAALAWFALIFPGGWSTATGHTGVILTYIGGFGPVGIAGAAIPLATDPRDVEIAGLADENDGLRASKADEAALEGTIDDFERDVADAEADEADLAAHLRRLRTSQAQFEHYRDNGGGTAGGAATATAISSRTAGKATPTGAVHGVASSASSETRPALASKSSVTDTANGP